MKKQASEETLLILEAIHKLGTAIENLTYAVDHLRPDPAVEFEQKNILDMSPWELKAHFEKSEDE